MALRLSGSWLVSHLAFHTRPWCPTSALPLYVPAAHCVFVRAFGSLKCPFASGQREKTTFVIVTLTSAESVSSPSLTVTFIVTVRSLVTSGAVNVMVAVPVPLAVSPPESPRPGEVVAVRIGRPSQ